MFRDQGVRPALGIAQTRTERITLILEKLVRRLAEGVRSLSERLGGGSGVPVSGGQRTLDRFPGPFEIGERAADIGTRVRARWRTAFGGPFRRTRRGLRTGWLAVGSLRRLVRVVGELVAELFELAF